jgi:hypothetical protein
MCRAGRRRTSRGAVWLAKLTERGLLRPSFVPPKEIRQLRDYTRLRTDLTRERTRHWARGGEAARGRADQGVLGGVQAGPDLGAGGMIEALIAGQRDPRALAELARGPLRAKRAALREALNGQFDDHHGELARILLDQIDGLSTQIDQLDFSIGKLIAAIPAAQPPAPGDGHSGDSHRGDGGLGHAHGQPGGRSRRWSASRNVIVWCLLADPTARYHDLGADYHDTKADEGRRVRSHVRKLEALGFTVTLTEAA